ncbi:MAG: penicillin-binding protein activator [Rhodospirillales bacterium]|nr:penicillin-binding protein activator [Rhodospirillales bacterium]
MFERPSLLRRLAAMAVIAVVLIPLGACESSRIPLLGQDKRTGGDKESSQPSAGTAKTDPMPRLTISPTRRAALPSGGEAMRPDDTRPSVPSQAVSPFFPGEPRRVALLLPLSGESAALGRSLVNAAQLALFDFAGGDFELMVHDTGGTAEGAQSAMQVALSEGVSLVLGPLFSRSVRAVQPMAWNAGVPVVAFSNDPAAIAPGVYLLGFQPNEEVIRVVRFAASKGVTRFALLAPDNAYGGAVRDAYHKAVAAAGGIVTTEQFYDPSLESYGDVVRELANYDHRRADLLAQRRELEDRGDEIAREALKRMEKLETIGDVPYEALLVAEGGKRLQAIAAMLPFYDIDPAQVRIMGTGLWDVEGLGAEPALQGGWYAAPPRAARSHFINRYRQTYGLRPVRLATLAYDAVALASILARGENAVGFTDAALTAPSGFAGRDGIFRLMPGGFTQRGLAVLEVRRGENRVIDPAPEAFPAALVEEPVGQPAEQPGNQGVEEQPATRSGG